MIQYILDADNNIVDVGGEWDTFARDNDGEECARDQVIGRPLFDFFLGQEVQAIYREIFAKARRTGKPIAFTFRCDAPAFRRRMQLRIEPRPDGNVTVETSLLEEEPRDPVPLFDAHAPRSDEIIPICCICGDVQSSSGEWVAVEVESARRRLLEHAVIPQLSHGYCPRCLKDQLAILEENA